MAGGAQVVGGRRLVRGESCGGRRVRGARTTSSSPPPPSSRWARRPSISFPPSLRPSPARAELQDLAESQAPVVSTACGWTDLQGTREFGCLEGQACGLDGAPSSLRPGKARKEVQNTRPQPQTPAGSPNSRRMELRKVPSSSSGSPVLGRERQKGFRMGEAAASRKPHRLAAGLFSHTAFRAQIRRGAAWRRPK